METLLFILFVGLLLLLIVATYRAGYTLLFWSLFIFFIVCLLFVFYQYVSEYEKKYGVGSWKFDPFHMLNRPSINRLSVERQAELRRLRLIMSDLGYTKSEIELYMAMFEANNDPISDLSIRELLLLEDIIKVAKRNNNGNLTTSQKDTFKKQFKEKIDSVQHAIANPETTTTPATTGISKISKGTHIANIDYQIINPPRTSASNASLDACTKCVMDKFDSLQPSTHLADTVDEYTQLLLGNKQSAIDNMVNATHTKCFKTTTETTAEKANAKEILNNTFLVYLFGNSMSKTIPTKAQNYINNLVITIPTNEYQNTCNINNTEILNKQDNLTKAIHSLYKTYKESVNSVFKSSSETESSSSSASSENILTAILPLNSYDKSLGIFSYAPISSPTSTSTTTTTTKSIGSSFTPPFTANDLVKELNSLFANDATTAPLCTRCINDVLADLEKKIASTEYDKIIRALRHYPIAKSTFMVALLNKYVKFFITYCVKSEDQTDTNINMHIYIKKLLALTQLFWSVIIQALYN